MSSPGTAFTRALALQQAGDFEQAERLYEQILRSDHQNAEAWHLLGLVVHRSGRLDKAAECIGRAVSLDGSSAVFQCDLGAMYHQLGRLDEAIDCFQQAVQLAPEQPHTHYNLGIALQQRGDQVGAKLRFQQAVRLRPEFLEAWSDLGIVHQKLGELDQAAECFGHTISLAPGSADGHFNLGNIHLAQDRLLEAVACYVRAIERQPQFAKALNNLGTALHRLRRFEPAQHAYQAALRWQPDFADARNNLGALLSVLGRHAEAEVCYREAATLDPRSVAALNNLAGRLQAQMQLDESEALLRQALAVDSQSADALWSMANVLSMQGRAGEAAGYYRQSLNRQRYNPRLLIQAATMLPPVYESLDELRRYRETVEDNLTELLSKRVALDPTKDAAPVNFLLAYQGLNDRDLARRAAGLYRSAADGQIVPPPPHFTARPAATDRRGFVAPTAAETAAPGRPIRIGFLSKFLRDHTIGDLMKGLICHLSRRDFFVTVFVVGEAADETVSFLRQCANAFVPLPEDVATAHSIVAAASIDVLVFPDVGMDPVSYSLAFSRLAPVQCAMWGHPVTTGIPTIDHFISSRLIEPAAAAEHYTENLVLLESLPTYYYPPQITPGEKPIAAPLAGDRAMARQEFNLPQEGHLYLCPQSLFKFHPDFDPLLSAILQRDSAGRLVLIEGPHRHWTDLLSRRLKETMDGQFDRVSFVSRVDRQAFLRLLTTADVILDPLHFGGGNTSFQALGLGVPIVTLPASFMRGRVTAGCYRKMGDETCVVHNASEYVDLAVRLGTDREFNALVRSEINSRSPVLFEDMAAVRELEEFFKAASRAAADRGSPAGMTEQRAVNAARNS